MSPAPPHDQRVTSSDLVRHFGIWQERAARAPVYVLHRGRPRFVLARVEAMDALRAPYDDAASPARHDIDALLDGVSDLVLIADADLHIAASSAAARAHLGSLAANGARIETLAPPQTRGFFIEAVHRVLASGVADRIDLPSPARPARMLALTIAPIDHGIALFAQDMTTEHDHRRALATGQALRDAAGVVGGIATVSINPRGYVVDPEPALSALTGLTREALAMIRFAALIEIGVRIAVSDTIEAVLSDGRPRGIDATLLVNRAAPLAVRIGFAAIRSSGAIDSVTGILAANPV